MPKTHELLTDAEALEHATERIAKRERELAEAWGAYHKFRAALDAIATYGGITNENGIECDGRWCADQARAVLTPRGGEVDYDHV